MYNLTFFERHAETLKKSPEKMNLRKNTALYIIQLL